MRIEAYDRAFPVIVTAKHVLDKIADDTVLLRVNTVREGTVKYVPISKSKWHFHPQHNEEKGPKYKYIDVAAYAPDFDWTDLDFVLFGEDDIVSDAIRDEYDIGTGDEVVIIGLFFSHIGELRNRPLIRIGNIAAMPNEPVQTDLGLMDAYLIETRSIGGISGSPVFTHLAVRPEETVIEAHPWPKLEKKKLKKAERIHFLLGLVQGYYTIRTQEEWVSKTSQEVGDLNTGISVVVPASKIVETINQIDLRGRIEMTAKELDEYLKRKSGAKSASIDRAACG